MSPDLERASVARIEMTRRIGRKAGAKCAERGVTLEEVAIAALYSAFDAASAHAGPGIAAVEWLRTGADMLEREILSNDR